MLPPRRAPRIRWLLAALASAAVAAGACSTTPQFVADTSTGTGGHGQGSTTSGSTSGTSSAGGPSSTSASSSATSTSSASSAGSSSSSASTTASSSSSSGCIPKTCASVLANCGFISDGCNNMIHCGVCQGMDACGVVQPNQCANAIQAVCSSTATPACPSGYVPDGTGFSSDACLPGTACNLQATPLGYFCVRPAAIYTAQCSLSCPTGSHIAGPWPAACCTQSSGQSTICIQDP